MRRKRLHWQLFLSYLWVTIGAVVLVGVYGAHTMRQFYLEQTRKDLETRAKLCTGPILERMDRGDHAAVDALCKELGRTPGVGMRITAILPDGRVIGDTAESPQKMDNHRGRPEVREAIASATSLGHSMRYSDTTKEGRMYVAVAVRRQQSLAAVVRVSLPTTVIDETIAGIRWKILLAGLASAALVALVSLWVSRRISRPLEETTAGAERFARGELEHRLRGSDYQEIDTLSTAMNRMAAQLDARIRTIIRQQNEQEAMLVSMDEGVLAVDEQGRILNLNQACATMFQIEVGELKGRMIHETLRRPDLLQFVEQTLSSDSPVDSTIHLHCPGHRQLRVHGTTLHDAAQTKIGALIVMRDITRLQQLETVRQDFVANVSHELGTPITAVKGFVETLLDGALDDRDTARRFLQRVLGQVNRLDTLADDLLTLARLDGGPQRKRLDIASAPVERVLASALEACQYAASVKNIHVELDCDEELAADVDSLLLERAVVNLIDNAVKYSATETTVRVSARREGEIVLIQVQDEGVGIAAKHLPRLFERFYRVDRARSREMGGTGLGLAIVKHIVLLHHGSIDVESVLGKGSTFSIRLPAKQPTLAASE